MSAMGVILGWMDCPTCGLTNPPEAVRCDCGYDFKAMEPFDTPGWQINLAWRQKVAAYWSISWPAWAVSFTLSFLVTIFFSFDAVARYIPMIALGGNLAFF